VIYVVNPRLYLKIARLAIVEHERQVRKAWQSYTVAANDSRLY